MTPAPDSRDHIGVGCGMGCAVGIAFSVVGLFVAGMVGNNTFSNIIFFSTALTQWLGLIPLILYQRSINHPKTVKGIILAGCLGMLLCSACASVMLLPSMLKSI